MNLLIAALVGYLAGSLSGARIVGRRYAPGDDLRQTRVVLDGTGASVLMEGVSPSALQARAGARGGLRAGAIDILKALIPTLIVRLLIPEGPEHVIVAAAAVVGHVYPIFHRFSGGFGISPLLGGLVVVDLAAPAISIAVFGIIGLAVGNAFLGIETWPLGLIPWFAVMGDEWTVAYAIVVNALYWWRSRYETRGAFRSWRHDPRPWRERVGDFRRYPDYEMPDGT